MKQLSEKQIQDNFETLMGVIDKYISAPRKEKLSLLYTDKQEIIALAPAAGKENYHNCFPGGYVEHILNVVNIGLNVNKLWEDSNAVNTHTEEELVFALLNHDLGKIGEGDEPYFIPNPSEWHRKNQGAIYAHNPAINFMPVPERSLFILQQYGIECSFNEYVAIRTHDGLYDEANKSYYMSYNEDGKLRTNLPFIVHQADMMASRIEWQQWKYSTPNSPSNVAKAVRGSSPVQRRMNTLAAAPKSESASKIFDDLFKDK